MEALRFALLGLASGGLVALVALGVVLTYRASGVLNFAAGAVGAFGAFLFYELRDERELPTWLALVIALAVGAALGALTQLLVLSMLRTASTLAKLIASLGLMVLVQGVITIIWGEEGLGQPDSLLPKENLELTDELIIGRDRLFIIGIAILLALLLRIVYSKTLFGLVTSAVAENRQVTALGGWSPSRIELANFTIAGVLSAIAAILIAPIVSLNPTVLTLLIIPALAAALVGGFRSFAVTVAAALAIGVVQSELRVYLVDIAEWFGVDQGSIAGLPDAVPMLVIIIATVVAGRARLARGETVAKLPLPGPGNVPLVPTALGVAIVAALLLILPTEWVDALVVTLLFAVVLLSVVVVTGYGGQLSLAQFALAGFGGWVAARSFSAADVPFPLALVLAVVCTVPVGLLVALPALRTRGVNLAVATLGLALMIQAIVFNNGALTGGFSGTTVQDPTLFGLRLDPVVTPERYGLVILAALVVVGLVVANVRRGRAGRRLLAVRGNERAAASLGVGVYGAKLYAFGLASAIAALAGGLYVFRQENVRFSDFNVVGSIVVVQYAVIGGIGWISGVVIGGALASGALLDKVLSSIVDASNGWLLAIAGAGVLLTLRSSPDGSAQTISESVHSLTKRWRGMAGRRRADHRPDLSPARGRSPATLDVREISVHFGGVVALQGVSFSVHPGEVVGLIGPNGAGKTTMLDVVTGFTRPTTGTVALDGVTVDGWSPERRARAGMARSWQAVELFEEMTTRDNLLVGADRQEVRRYFTDLLRPGRLPETEVMRQVVEQFELEQVLDDRPASLSHGQARLVGIARAICMEPSILMLDEPAAGLDAAESGELGLAIRQVARERGIGILLVEHDVPLLMATCDRIVVLDFGVKIAEGAPTEVQRDENVIKAYLGEEFEVPPTATSAPAVTA